MAELFIDELNREIKENPKGLISRSEDEYHAKISALAQRVVADGRVRVILLAGPSGSGKTTSANLLSDAIKSHGEGCMVISLDDFYRNADDPCYPLLKNGERDFEAVEALDIPFLVRTLSDIASGRPFQLPKYDFKVGARVEVRSFESIGNGCVIIEGLHALNPLIFESLPSERVLKIFISVSTNINDSEGRMLSGRKIRFMRRMIRDSIYRGADARRTLSMWGGVLRGEDEYLYPTRKYADVTFDTFHPFELAVMRPFAERLIDESLADENEYARAVRNCAVRFLPIDISLVPDESLIREFIPGGKYESVY